MVRTQIIELILATDMNGHFETVSRFRVSFGPVPAPPSYRPRCFPTVL